MIMIEMIILNTKNISRNENNRVGFMFYLPTNFFSLELSVSRSETPGSEDYEISTRDEYQGQTLWIIN